MGRYRKAKGLVGRRPPQVEEASRNMQQTPTPRVIPDDRSMDLDLEREPSLEQYSLPLVFDGLTTFEAAHLENCDHGFKYMEYRRKVTLVNYQGKEETRELIFQSAPECTCVNEPVIHNDVQRAGQDYFVHASLLVRLMASGLTCQTPLSAFHKSLKLECAMMGDENGVVDIKRLTAAYDLFRDKIATKEAWFCCEQCGEFPDTLVVDGIQLGTRRAISNGITKENAPEVRAVMPHKKRIFVAEKGIRTKVNKYARREINVTQLAPHIPKEYDHLRHFLEACADSHGLCVPACKDIILDLSSASSALVVFPARNNGHELLKNVASGWNPYDSPHNMETFMSNFPVLHPALQYLYGIHGNIPEVARKLLDAVCGKLETLEKVNNGDYEDLPPTESSLDVFPSMPKKRDLPVYKNDEIMLECDPKLEKGRKRLSSGLMLFLCQHGKTYGAQVMDGGESPKHVFEMLMTRYPKDRMPQRVIYDNACRLAEYCLSREYHLFANTAFFVDRFHAVNHKGCARAVRMNHYKWSSDLAMLNSQCCEQTNAQLKYLRRFVSYMSQTTYIQTIRLYLAHTNCRLGL